MTDTKEALDQLFNQLLREEDIVQRAENIGTIQEGAKMRIGRLEIWLRTPMEKPL